MNEKIEPGLENTTAIHFAVHCERKQQCKRRLLQCRLIPRADEAQRELYAPRFTEPRLVRWVISDELPESFEAVESQLIIAAHPVISC